MILPPVAAVGAALALSVMVHLGAASTFREAPVAEVAGGRSAAPARLGTSFTDMIEGRAGATTPELTTIEPTTSDATATLTPTEMTQPALPVAAPVEAVASPVQTTSTPPVEVAGAVQPARPMPSPPVPEATTTEAALPVEQMPVVTTEVTMVPSAPTLAPSAPMAPAESVTAVEQSEPVEPVAEAVEAPPVEQSEPIEPVAEAIEATPVEQSEPIKPVAEAIDALPVEQSATATFAPEATTRPPRRPPPAQPPAATGNAAVSAERGTMDGEASAQSSEASMGEQNTADQSGTAAAVTYKDEVIRLISSTRKRRVPKVPRDTTIAFTIAPDGALAEVSVLESSGNLRLDRASLRHIERAAPFPPPPDGAPIYIVFEFLGSD